MVLAALFDRFVADSPLTVMARVLMENALQPGPIDEMFERTAKVQYTEKLLFSTVVDMMGMVVCGCYDSPRAVYLARREDFPVALTNVYEKLNGIELPVTQQLVRDNAARLTEVVKALGGCLPQGCGRMPATLVAWLLGQDPGWQLPGGYRPPHQGIARYRRRPVAGEDFDGTRSAVGTGGRCFSL